MLQPYELIFNAMCDFTDRRDSYTLDEIWLVEHLPVFTNGLMDRTKHLLIPKDIPLIKTNRGGRITYHGPGQQIMYVLLNLRRRKIGISKLVKLLEQTVVNTLAEFGIESYPRSDAPGVYVDEMKICSIGLCIRKGCSLHGLALNVNMDLSPFLLIEPCGYAEIKMTQMHQWIRSITPDMIQPYLIKQFLILLNNPAHQYI